MIHSISLPPGKFGGEAIERLFTNQLDWSEDKYYEKIKGIKVSAHVLIRRDGNLIQFVDFDKRAWHAGDSCYEGRERCNDFSIGIELEGSDDKLFSDIQYEQLASVLGLLLSHYKIPKPNIVGHSEIAPGRKTDPGPMFDWQKLYTLI